MEVVIDSTSHADAPLHMRKRLSFKKSDCDSLRSDDQRETLDCSKNVRDERDGNKTQSVSTTILVKIAKVSCGVKHTVALSDDGSLWSWGTGSQLGLGDVETASTPQPVKLPLDRHVIGVSCGAQHTVALAVRCGDHDCTDRDCTGNLKDWKLLPKLAKECTGDEKITASGCTNEANLMKKGNSLSSEGPAERAKAFTSQTCCKSNHAANSLQLEDGCISADSEIELQILPSSNAERFAEALSCANIEEDVKFSALRNNDCNKIIESSLNEISTENHCPLTTTMNNGLRANDAGSDHIAVLSVNCERSKAVDPEPAHSSGAKLESNLNVAENSSGAAQEQHSLSCTACDHCAGVPKSRSSFLDETQAKEFLQRQLNDIDSSGLPLRDGKSAFGTKDGEQGTLEKKDSVDSAPSASPFARTMGTLLQHVPSSPVIVQEYVTNLTRSVVSNLRTSMDRRFNFVTSQVEMSLSGLVSLGKVPNSDSSDSCGLANDGELLNRLVSCQSSHIQYLFAVFKGKHYFLF